MKSDREFLDGVYEKAKSLPQKKEKTANPFRITFMKRYSGVIAAAAVLVAVISPILNFNSTTMMHVPKGFSENEPFGARAFSMPNLNASQIAEGSDLILRAKVTKINDSVYENENLTTDIELAAKDIYKGKLDAKKIDLTVYGGYDAKTKDYIPYEAMFECNEDTILFLNCTKESAYTLSYSKQGKYEYVETLDGERFYQNIEGDRVSISQLVEILK